MADYAFRQCAKAQERQNGLLASWRATIRVRPISESSTAPSVLSSRRHRARLRHTEIRATARSRTRRATATMLPRIVKCAARVLGLKLDSDEIFVVRFAELLISLSISLSKCHEPRS